MTSENVREAEFNRLVAKAEAIEHRIEADLCIRRDTTGAMTCTQPYEHTGRCDWFKAADAAYAIARDIEFLAPIFARAANDQGKAQS